MTVTRVINDTGTVASQTNGRGYKTTYTYDDTNRLVGITPPRAGSSSVAITYNLNSNGMGLRTWQVTRGRAVKTDVYDPFGRVEESVSKDTGTGAAITVTRRFDLVNRVVFESYPNSTAGRVLAYDALDRTVRQTHADLTTQRFTYQPRNEVVVADERNNQTTFRHRSFGNPDQRALMDTVAPEGITITATRNKLDMMLTATEGGFTQSWAYDTRFFPLSYTHPEVGIMTYGTDGVGNITRKTLAGKTTNLIYDNLNRPVTIDYPAGTLDIKYSYNKNNAITYYLYARNGNLMYEYSPVDNLSREHVYLDTQRIATVARNDAVLDTDNDGMSDAFEVQSGNLNPFSNTDANLDYDADGLTNLKEYQSGSNPNKADTDSDGLTDAQEVLTYGTNPSLSDTDGDGVGDKAEVDSGRNPNLNEAAVLVPIIQLLLD